ncbi:MAG TPA: GntR family transcriptional regulator [Candidatus Acidoferrum sp.]|nr:GntR family transcriptional regulator [Candidatus Acidoferrum sp.]
MQDIYLTVKQRIIHNTYAPGSVLSEGTLALEFGVSRTPVREALRRLQQDRWVVTLPKVGVQVSQISMRELRDSFEVRKLLEVFALRKAMSGATSEEWRELWRRAVISDSVGATDPAAMEADVNFHRQIWQMAHNEVAARTLEEIVEREVRWWHSLRHYNPSIALKADRFSDLVSCMQTGNEVGAAAFMKTHIDFYIAQIRNEIF